MSKALRKVYALLALVLLPAVPLVSAQTNTAPGTEAAESGTWPLERAPYPYESTVPGLFAVGDVRCGSVKRVASAVGEGSVVVSQVHDLFRARQ